VHNLNKQTNSHVNKLHDPNILVLVVKSSIFTLEKISLHKFGIEFNQKFNGYVSIRILVLYDVVRRRMTLPCHVTSSTNHRSQNLTGHTYNTQTDILVTPWSVPYLR
jgi:hypothetical protein